MRLNPNCIRDILLTVEENEDMYYPGQYELLNKYDSKEIIYHLKQCHMSGLLTNLSSYVDGGYCVDDLTPQGHELISQIRSTSNWTKILKNLSEIGTSIKTIIEVAALVKTL